MGKSASKEITAKDVEEAVKSTKYSKQEVERWAQVFKKEFPNGKMTKKDCKRVIATEFPMFNSDAVSDYLFKALDQDHSGSVDFREFVTAQSILNEGPPAEKLSFIFKMYDTDGSKFISQKELETIFSAIYKGAKVPDAAKKAKQEAADFIKQSDKDGDAKLSEQEFVQFLLPRVSGILP